MNRLFCRPAGCERTDHGSEAGWGACMCLETHQKVVCLGLLDGNPWAIKAGWGLACVFSRRIRKWFVWTCWMGTQRRSRGDGLANVFRDASEIGLSRAAGCERKGDQGGGLGLACVSRDDQKLDCLGLLDGNAWAIKAGWGLACVSRDASEIGFVSACWIGTHGPSRRGGMGACMYLATHQKFVSGPAECEGTGNHSQQDGGTCTYFKVHGRSLAHRSKRIHGELVFTILILNSWGCMYFETQAHVVPPPEST